MKKYIIPGFLISSIIIINLVSYFVLKEISIIAMVASIAGVISCVMAAKGHISCYYFGIINILFYMLITYSSKFYGALALTILFSLPMQFYGIYIWKKNLNKDTKLVISRRLSMKLLMLWILISVSLAWGYSLMLSLFNSTSPFLESLLTFFNIIALYLTVKRYNEQWIFWIMINGINLYMWTMATINGNPNGLIMSAMWILYLINAVYGYVNWYKLEENK